MAKSTSNMFERLTGERAAEQQDLEKKLTAGSPKKPVGRPKKRKDCKTIALTISAEDKELVQAYAYEHSLSVSDLMHLWIRETCVKKD